MRPRPRQELRPVDESVLELLVNVARYLLAAGIKLPQFSAIARLAYFNAASEQARTGTERLNQSAVAAMTGLTRVQVRQLAINGASVRKKDHLDAVVEGWNSDPSFSSRANEPRSLRVGGSGSAFALLVRRYGSDLPARSVLREMQRQGLVRIRGGAASLQPLAREKRGEAKLRRTAAALAGLVRVPVGAAVSDSVVKTLNAETAFPAAAEKGRVLLQRRTAEGIRALLALVQAAGEAAAIDAPSRVGKKKTTRVRIAVLVEDVDE